MPIAGLAQHVARAERQEAVCRGRARLATPSATGRPSPPADGHGAASSRGVDDQAPVLVRAGQRRCRDRGHAARTPGRGPREVAGHRCAGGAHGQHRSPASSGRLAHRPRSGPRGDRVHRRAVQPVGPLGERHPRVLALVEQAALEGLLGAREAVQVLVEQRQPAGVLGHQREAGAVDRVPRRPARSRTPWRTGSCPLPADR